MRPLLRRGVATAVGACRWEQSHAAGGGHGDGEIMEARRSTSKKRIDYRERDSEGMEIHLY